MGDDKKRTLVLDLLEQDVQHGLDAAVSEKRQVVTRFVEAMWDKYRVTLTALRNDRASLESSVGAVVSRLGYS